MPAQFTATIQVPVITLELVLEVTDLDWTRYTVTDPNALPSVDGVYVWGDPVAPHVPLYYVGSASSDTGLRKRLGNQFSWRTRQAERIQVTRTTGTEQAAWEAAREVPAVRVPLERGLAVWAAAVKPASWSVNEEYYRAPETALDWESLIMGLSHVVTGHRGVLGAGAWDAKQNSGLAKMTGVAWDRLTDLYPNWWMQ